MEAADKNTQIFNTISSLMVDPEFITLNQSFFAQNCDKFEADEEENKHEYKQIYEEFLSIQENVIETKLKEQHSEDDVLEFYTTFQDKMKAYEQINKDTVDFLFEMIEFDKFKSKMCRMKASFEGEKENLAKMNQMRHSKPLGKDETLDLENTKTLLTDILAESVTATENGWKLRVA